MSGLCGSNGVGVACLLLSVFAAGSDAMEGNSSYGRYPHYPAYCSTPDAMRSRSVPRLMSTEEYRSGSGGIEGSSLAQVVAVIRHGARTPWSTKMSCWDGYWQSPLTGVWDCDLTTMTAPPSPPFVQQVEHDPNEADDPEEAREGDDAMFLFEKRYDALRHPPDLANGFNGTCQIGQLLLRGYEQEMANGRHIRDAYVYDGSAIDGLAATDQRMRLFDLTESAEKRPYEPPNLYYRVDDEQRTIMSGQVLIRGLFGDLLSSHRDEIGEDPVIITHTADYHYDVLAPNSRICPRLEDLWDASEQSPEYMAFNNSADANLLSEMMLQTMGADFMDNIVDCLMTTICTDRPLPDVLNDYAGDLYSRGGGSPPRADGPDDGNRTGNGDGEKSSSPYDDAYGRNRFARLIDFATRRYTYHLRYDDAAYAKLGMAPLWGEILEKIVPVIKTPADQGGEIAPPKLALFSGHDSTLMPLLATLGPDVFDGTEWSPYASMVLIEVHRVDAPESSFPLKHAFRLIFNGEVLTPKMAGCPEDVDLCDVTVLLDLITPLTLGRDCSSDGGGDGDGWDGLVDEMEKTVHQAEALLITPAGIALFLLVALLCAALGAFATYVYLTRKLQVRSGTGGNFYRRNAGGGNDDQNGGHSHDGGREHDGDDDWVYGESTGDKEDDRIHWQVT